jgi:YbbR domain-containing protein
VNLLRRAASYLPTLILAFAMSAAVWISAVTSSDPVEERVYPRSIAVEIIGQDPSLILTSSQNDQLTLRMSAPNSIWDRLVNDRVAVRAVVDLSGKGEGTYELPIQPQIDISPIKIISFTPRTYKVSLEKNQSAMLPVQIISRGEPAIGFEAGKPVINQPTATVSGPQSLVERVKSLQVVLDISRANETLTRSLTIQAVDESGLSISGVTLTPEQVTLTQPITQRGGYRNVVVKVVTAGQVGDGYRLTTVSVYPPTITVFAANPILVDNLPGYVETVPVDLTGAKDDIDTRLNLNLPEGISVVGEQTVNVVVGISAIEGSLTLNDRLVEMVNLDPKLAAEISPQRVTIILSGPLPLLDRLQSGDTRITLDLGGLSAGTYQLTPKIELALSDLRVESVLPGTIEVTISPAPTPTPTPRR